MVLEFRVSIYREHLNVFCGKINFAGCEIEYRVVIAQNTEDSNNKNSYNCYSSYYRDGKDIDPQDELFSLLCDLINPAIAESIFSLEQGTNNTFGGKIEIDPKFLPSLVYELGCKFSVLNN